jgi:hypothetical protein
MLPNLYRLLLAVVTASALATTHYAMADAEPVLSAMGPDAAAYGAAQNYPAHRGGPSLPQLSMVGDYSRFDTLYPAHVVAKPTVPLPLRRADEEISLTYEFRGSHYDLDEYLQRNPATGLLVARGDTILFEHYQYNRTDRDRFLSQSMTKTAICMLLGIAVSEGAIHTIDQPVADYVPELTGT